MNRDILHCDMNNFYASVECMLNPKLRNKPIAVCGSVEERHGIVLAKNYPAKAFGVSTGEAIWQAKQKCKDLVVVNPHYEEYIKYSKYAREIYSRYTDLIEPFGMDECWLDISGYSRSSYDIANEIKETIKFELGLTISIGVSFNKIFAKLGSDMKKPDAITVIDKETFREKIWGLPASDLLGVGRATKAKLDNYGILTIGELANAPEHLLQSLFGKNGLLLSAYANGNDYSSVMPSGYTPPIKSVGHGVTTVRDLENLSDVYPVILELSQDIGAKLRKYDFNAAGVAIDVRDSDLFVKQWQCHISTPTNSSAIIAEKAFDLFNNSYRWRNGIRSITVRAINLVSANDPRQQNFYEDFSRIERKEKIEEAIDEIRRRFGKEAIIPASLFFNKGLTSYHAELSMPTGLCR